MPITRDLKSGYFFSDQHPRPNSPKRSPRKLSFLFGPPTPLHRAISREKRGSICQRLQLVEYLSNQTLAYIGVTKKKLSPFCLQRTTRITQENEARNRNTSIRSRVILEFWNIWSLNLRFLWATDPNFPLSGSFGHPYGERKIGSVSGRVGIYAFVCTLPFQFTAWYWLKL